MADKCNFLGMGFFCLRKWHLNTIRTIKRRNILQKNLMIMVPFKKYVLGKNKGTQIPKRSQN